MSVLPINLIVFCTTMGHGGEHTYKQCIDHLFEKIDPLLFANRVLHLKVREGEEDIASEVKDFCSKSNIRVIVTNENIVHHSENHLSHSAGYYKDIYKAYSDIEIRKQKYSFWLEDDELLQINTLSLEEAFKHSINFLDQNPDQLCVRFNRADFFAEPTGDFLYENENILTQAINYCEWGPTFTFQPNISRTNEIFIAWKEAQKHLDKLGQYHCEMVSGAMLKKLTNSQTPFSFFNPKIAFSKTIG